MERRIFLAISLAILVMYLYQVYLVPPAPPRPAPAAQGTATPPEPGTPAEPPVGAPTAPGPAASAPAALTSEAAEREIVVNTQRAEIVLTNRGGRVLHWRLKGYLDDQGRPIDLVPSSDLPAGVQKPFSLATDDPQLTRRLNDVLYRASGDTGSVVDATSGEAAVTFEYQDEAGLAVRKEFQFDPDSYLVTFSATVTNGGQTLNPAVHWGPGLSEAGALSAGGSFFTGNYVQPPGGIYHRDEDVERLTTDDVAEQPVHEGEFRYAGIDDHYFLVSALTPGRTRVEYATVAQPAGESQHRFLSFALRFEQGPQNVRFFVGPKDLDSLRSVDPQLVYTINFGIFRVLVVWLLIALKWVYGFIGNYGWAIILLTVLINLVMFPLRHKSLVSMRKMQLIQPQVKAIQERYADLKMTDPARQKMNTEIMNLYREKGANPAAGCVPMLLTFPVLFAFYSMLSQSIELRGADFAFWINDLSAKDPYYVTPLLMGVTMFWQQWMAPTTADPMQQRMMMVMPVVFTVMFLGFPSGLAIYYLVSNLFQIGQQYFTNRVIGPPPAVQPIGSRAVRPPKPAGSGRTAAAERKN